MTGCDLRFLAEEMARDVRDVFTRRAADCEAILHLVVNLKTTPVCDVALAIEAIESRVASLSETLDANGPEMYDRVTNAIGQVREHFHEAVDARVQDELQSGEYVDEEAKDEAIREALSDLREAIEADVIQAIRDAG